MPRETGWCRSGQLWCLWGIACLYFCISAAAMLWTSATAGLDQSEQLLLSQTLQPGYSAQPPLYTYLVKAVFLVTGPGLAPLLALKAVLLGLFAGILLALGREFGFSLRQHLVSMAGIVFIPQFIWESQRDLTHSVLVTILAAVTLLQLVRTCRRATIINYAVLGAVIGLGLISKYNYAVFLIALLLAVLATPDYRAVLTRRRALAILPVAIMVAAPHGYWLLTNLDIATGTARKLHIGEGGLASGIGSATQSALAFLAPLLVFSTILISRPLKRNVPGNTGAGDRRLLRNLVICTVVVVGVFILLTGVQNIKDRWYQPLLFYAPLIPAMFLAPTKTRLSWYVGLGMVLALLVSVALVARTSLAGRFNTYSHPNVPYPDLVAAMGDITPEPAFILAESKLLGGNARPVFPEAVIQVPGFRINTLPLAGEGLVVCETPDCDDREFTAWLEHNHGIAVQQLEFHRIEKPYYHLPSKRKTIYVSRVRLPQSPLR